MRVKLVNGDAKRANMEEMEKLVYEEFDTTKHEVLAICMETPTQLWGSPCS